LTGPAAVPRESATNLEASRRVLDRDRKPARSAQFLCGGIRTDGLIGAVEESPPAAAGDLSDARGVGVTRLF